MYKNFKKDVRQLARKRNLYQPGAAIAGGVFAATIINPNYTRRQSFFLRKINVLLFGTVFYALAKKEADNQQLHIMLKMYDYLPYDFKRTLATKDYRYMAIADQSTLVFDARTGKSLS